MHEGLYFSKCCVDAETFFFLLTLDALQGKIVALCFKKEAAIDQIEKKWGRGKIMFDFSQARDSELWFHFHNP